MNYYELINNCLLELGYKQVNSFSELTKQDHAKIMANLNRVNADVCSHSNWIFLQKKTDLIIPPDTIEVANTIPGRISSISIGNTYLNFNPDFRSFLVSGQPFGQFSVFNDKILFSPATTQRIAQVVYYSSNYVVDSDGLEKAFFENQTDESLIPSHFDNLLLVYGACMKMKTNMDHPKTRYWYAMYNDALANLRSEYAKIADNQPKISLKRF